MKLFLEGPVGRLEALYERPPEGTATRAVAVVCHPHPAHGGTMHNTVVYRTARGLRTAGVATLRFNFRGTEGSEGEHDGQGAEMFDAAAAVDWLAREEPELPIWAAGFSFGSRTVVALANHDARIVQVFCIALPTRVYSIPGLETLAQPTFFLFASEDEFGNLADFRKAVPDPMPAHFTTSEIQGSEHFFRRYRPELESTVCEQALAAIR